MKHGRGVDSCGSSGVAKEQVNKIFAAQANRNVLSTRDWIDGLKMRIAKHLHAGVVPIFTPRRAPYRDPEYFVRRSRRSRKTFANEDCCS